MVSDYANTVHHDMPAGKLIEHWGNIWKEVFWTVFALYKCVRKCVCARVRACVGLLYWLHCCVV